MCKPPRRPTKKLAMARPGSYSFLSPLFSFFLSFSSFSPLPPVGLLVVPEIGNPLRVLFALRLESFSTGSFAWQEPVGPVPWPSCIQRGPLVSPPILNLACLSIFLNFSPWESFFHIWAPSRVSPLAARNRITFFSFRQRRKEELLWLPWKTGPFPVFFDQIPVRRPDQSPTCLWLSMKPGQKIGQENHSEGLRIAPSSVVTRTGRPKVLILPGWLGRALLSQGHSELGENCGCPHTAFSRAIPGKTLSSPVFSCSHRYGPPSPRTG